MRDRVMTALKVRENRARRVLVRMGHRLEKSPRRDDRAIDFCLYRIVAAAGPAVSGGYTMTLPEVEAWIEAGPAARARPAAKPQPHKGNDAGRVDLRVGDCRDVLRRLPDGRYHTVVTSPPYYFVRDYDHPDQIGLEESPEAYVDALVEAFRQVRRVVSPDVV
jgi:hypothetical protein